MTLEVTEICQTCLALDCKLVSIYETKGFANIKYVSDVLKELTNILANKSNGIPVNVCLECIREINRFSSFKLKCENSYAIFRQMFQIAEISKAESIEEPKNETSPLCPDIKIPSQPNISEKPISLKVIPSKQTETIKKVPLNPQLTQFSPTAKPSEAKSQDKPTIEKLEILRNVELPKHIQIKKITQNPSVLIQNQSTQAAKVVKTKQDEYDDESTNSFDKMIEKLVFEDEADSPVALDLESWLSLKAKNNELKENQQSAEQTEIVKGNPPVQNPQSLKAPDIVMEDNQSLESLTPTKKKIRNERQLSNNSLTHKIDNNCQSRLKQKRSKACGICGKSFSLLSSLHNHMIVHSDERPFRCKFCEKTFRNKATHKLHELRHEKNRPFKCKECEHSFVCLKELKTHLRVHSADTPYVCEYCSRTFRYGNSLKCHIRIHTGDKPFICTHCPKKYTQLTSLTSHHDRHTDLSSKEKNECIYCTREVSK